MSATTPTYLRECVEGSGRPEQHKAAAERRACCDGDAEDYAALGEPTSDVGVFLHGLNSVDVPRVEGPALERSVRTLECEGESEQAERVRHHEQR